MGYVQVMMASLAVDDADARRCAVEDLASSEQPEAVLDLLVALRDPSTRVREAAVDVLASLVPARVCTHLTPLLASNDASLRGYVIEVLEAYGTTAEPQLIEATQSPDQDVRKFALDALVKNAKKNGDHSVAARQAITRCFSDANVNVAGAAIEALGYTRNRDYLPLIAKILKSESPWMQCAAIGSIVRLVGDEASQYFAAYDRSTLSEEAVAFLEALLPGDCVC